MIPPAYTIKSLSTTLIMTAAISLKDLLAIDHPIRPEIVSPWLREGDLSLIYAETGVGKTWFTLFLAVAIGSGGKVGGWHCEKRSVLYIDGEMTSPAIARRMKTILPEPAPPCDLSIISPDMTGGLMWNMSSVEGKKKLWPLIEKAEVIIIDNLMTVTARIDAFDTPIKIWERMQESLIKLRAMGKTIILVHHTNKAGWQSGTKEKENIQNTVIALKRCKTEPAHKGAKFVVDFEKIRDGVQIDKKTWLLMMEQGRSFWDIRSEGETIVSAIKFYREQGMHDRDIAKKLVISQATLKLYMSKDVSDLPSMPLLDIPDRQQELF